MGDLKQLREENKEQVARVTKMRQEQNKVQKAILAALTVPKTIPELATELNLAAKDVLWHIMAMRKYNQIQEDKKSGDYITYCKKS